MANDSGGKILIEYTIIEGILAVKSKKLLYIRETIPPYLKNIIDACTQTFTLSE